MFLTSLKILFVYVSFPSHYATGQTMPPAESMMDHTVETGECQGTTLTTCPDFTSPETCLLMGCSAIFPPHTLPTHREMCFCADDMKICSEFETNYECEYLAGCDWKYDFVFGESSDESETHNDRGFGGYGYEMTESPTESHKDRGIDFGEELTYAPTFTPTSSPTSSPTYSPTSANTATENTVVSDSNSSGMTSVSKISFVLFVIPSISFLFF